VRGSITTCAGTALGLATRKPGIYASRSTCAAIRRCRADHVHAESDSAESPAMVRGSITTCAGTALGLATRKRGIYASRSTCAAIRRFRADHVHAESNSAESPAMVRGSITTSSRHRRTAHAETCVETTAPFFAGCLDFLPKYPVVVTCSGDVRNIWRTLRKPCRSWSVEW